jgi:hypothetical protein
VDEAPFKMPPATAIAGVLIREWAEPRGGLSLKGFNPPTCDYPQCARVTAESTDV